MNPGRCWGGSRQQPVVICNKQEKEMPRKKMRWFIVAHEPTEYGPTECVGEKTGYASIERAAREARGILFLSSSHPYMVVCGAKISPLCVVSEDGKRREVISPPYQPEDNRVRATFDELLSNMGL